jgi:hydroxymethylbilane synthase
MVKRMRPDLRVQSLRGNVQTRLKKLETGEVDATLLAVAGLKRLGLLNGATAIFEIDEFLPAVGQGAIAIEARDDDTRTRDLLSAINHPETLIALAAERAFLAVLDGSCRTPIAGHARISGDRVQFRGLIVKPDGSEAHETARHGPVAEAAALAADAGRELRGKAGPGFFGPG